MFFDILGEFRRKLGLSKAGSYVPTECNSPIPRIIHVCSYDDGFIQLDLDWTTRAGEGLFVDMAVEQHAPIDELSLG